MKNFFSSVKKQGPLKSRMQLSIDKDMVDSQGMLTLWNLMDTMNSIKENRIQSLFINDRYEESVKKIDLKL